MHSWVRAQEGYYYSGDLIEAIHVAQHAQALSGQGPSVGMALAAVLEARAQAALGRQRETRAAFERAETCPSHLDASAMDRTMIQLDRVHCLAYDGDVSGMRALCQVASEHQCSRIEWTTDTANVLARTFYERLGMRPNEEKIFYHLDRDVVA